MNSVSAYYKKINPKVTVGWRKTIWGYKAIISKPGKTDVEVEDITGGTAINGDIEKAVRRMG